jgi:hypothetical protein
MQGRRELDTNALLVLRTFVNLFDGVEGRGLLLREYEKVWPKKTWKGEEGLMGRFLRLVRSELGDRVVNLSRLLSVLF